MNKHSHFHRGAMSAAIAATLFSGQIAAQSKQLEEVVVTATRRAQSLQDVPFNITALGSDIIQRDHLTNLVDIARRVPGMTVVDQGPRSGNVLTVRGLNVDSLDSPEATVGNSGGNTVATYVGEIPVYIDLKLNDLERVEVLLGPQGTLYGAGTLGGAVRYIPKRPDPDKWELELRGNPYALSHSKELGYEGGASVNIPIVADTLALRASLDYLNDPGFIDHNFLVREAGVSNPQPDFNDPEAVRANLRRQADVNTEETWSGRLALRYSTDRLDGTLSYYYQGMDIGGRQINHADAFGTGDYVAAHRFTEPSERKNELAALELVYDLGFAELTSATGISRYSENGRRDQTDLLLSLGFGYEEFPSFAAFTREDVNQEGFNQEFRLVSTGDSALSWIAGVFYNDFKIDQVSREYAPGFDQFAVDNFGGIQLRPDALEYYSTAKESITEQAVFGEIAYQLTDAWQVTVGARYFRYKDKATRGFDTPLFYTVFLGAPPDLIDPFLQSNDVDDDDAIFKFNTSYHFNDDIMGYLTVSEGYRLGGLNGLPPCVELDQGEPQTCALPDEIAFKPDTTVNYELGLHSRFNNGVLLNAALYLVDWKDVQIGDISVNGAQPIISNGSSARSVGVELSGQWQLTDSLSLRGTYTYNEAQLTADAPGLFDGTGALDGDRLPGTPEHQGSLAVHYTMPLNGGSQLDFDWSMTATGDVLTKVGEREFGEKLSAYALHNISTTWLQDTWRVSFYVDNLFDKYAETGVRADTSFIRRVGDFDLRRYYHNVLRPRQIGMRFSYHFDG